MKLRTGTLVGAALLALVAVASSAGLSFPYASCPRNVSRAAFSAPEVIPGEDGISFCVNLKFDKSQCTGEPPVGKGVDCCKADVHKLELYADPACKKGRFIAPCTLNGKPGLNAYLRSPPSMKDMATLYIPKLGLVTPEQIDGAQVCCTIDPRSNCATFDAVTGNLPWQTALWDSKHQCCPVTKDDTTCKSEQIFWTPIDLNPQPPKPQFDFMDTANQGPAIETINTLISSFETEFPGAIVSVTPVTFYTGPNAELQESGTITSASYTITFRDAAAGQDFVDYVAQFSDSLVAQVFGNKDCTQLSGQAPTLTGTGCAPTSTTPQFCSEEAPPPPALSFDFPKCPCDSAAGNMPFYAEMVGSDGTTLTYQIKADGTPTGSALCRKQTMFDKIEFYFTDAAQGWFVGSYVSYKKVGEPAVSQKFRAPSWGGANYPDTYKVNNFNLTLADFAEAPVFVQVVLKPGHTISDVTAAPGYIVTSVYDPEVDCCPTVATPYGMS